MNYEYKSVAFNAVISISNGIDEVTTLYNDILNKNAINGWEFYTMDEIVTYQRRGCFSEPTTSTLKIAIFRRSLE